jgi:hypothetical protein
VVGDARVTDGPTGAMSATKYFPAGVYAVAQDPTLTVLTSRCHTVDGTFEAVENMHRTLGMDFESQLVVISADLTHGHRKIPSPG